MKPISGITVEAFRKDAKQYEAARALLDGINQTRAALGNGTYVENPQYGKWGTIFVPVHAMRDDASFPPTWTPGSVGAIGILPVFTSGDAVHGAVAVPEAYAGGYFSPSAVFTFNGATTAGDTITWVLQMTQSQPGGSFIATVGGVAVYTNLAGDDQRRCEVLFPDIELWLQPGSIIVFKVTRSGAGAAVDPALIGVKWTYQRQKFGLEERP